MTNHAKTTDTISTPGSVTSTPQTKPKPKPASTLSKKTFHFTAGLASGLTTSILLQPADLLKTRLQQSSHTTVTNPLLSTLRSIRASPHPFRTLWRGTVPSALRTGIGSALYFGGLDQLRQLVLRHTPAPVAVTTVTTNGVSNKKPQLSPTANLLTGALARALAGLGVMPITVLKVRFESSLYSYPTLLSAIRAIYNTHGLRGFFAGFGATAVRDAPYAGLYVLFYESLKSSLRLAETPGSHMVGTFGAGVVAAAGATAITNPFDAVKTRIQVRPEDYRNLVSGGVKMVREEGWRCLFDGLGLRMARKAVSSALAWTVYEEVVRRAEEKLVI